MSISEGDIRKIAKLAKLRLTDAEIALYQGQMIKILDSMAELSHLDTSTVAPPVSELVWPGQFTNFLALRSKLSE